jgi:hypothetical protein
LLLGEEIVAAALMRVMPLVEPDLSDLSEILNAFPPRPDLTLSPLALSLAELHASRRPRSSSGSALLPWTRRSGDAAILLPREAAASDTGAVAAQLARILTALSGAASERGSCQAWLLLLVRRESQMPVAAYLRNASAIGSRAAVTSRLSWL